MKSIRGKISVSMALTVIISLLVTGITNVYLNYSSTNDTLEQTMTQAAAIGAERVHYELDSYLKVASEVGSIARIADPDRPLKDKVGILEQRAETHQFADYNLLNEKGVSLIDGTDYSDRTYVQEALGGHSYISEPLVSKKTGKLSVMVAAPLWRGGIPDSKVVGVVYFKPAETFLNDIVVSMQVSPNGSSYMLDSKGNTIAHKNEENVANQENTQRDFQTDSSLKDLAALELDMTNGNSGFGRYTYGGVTKFLAYAPIAGTDGWSLGINAPVNDFMASTIQSVIISVILTVAAAIVAVILAIQTAKGIGRPVADCAARLKLLAEGNLNAPVPEVHSKDETGVLASSTETIVSSLQIIIGEINWSLGEMAKGNFNISSQQRAYYKGDFQQILTAIAGIRANLSDALSQIQLSADQVSGGSDQVSAGAQALSQGATEQAASVEELAATISEISQHVQDTSVNTAHARENAGETSGYLGACSRHMDEMVVAMEEISSKSDQISKVIKTIEDIAFQTNILALNAAVEAARAGAAGKGFAVVADEVRNLATKSAEASKSTASLIEGSIQAAGNGTKIVNETAEALRSVSVSSQSVASLVEEIAGAAAQQATSIAQVTQGIDQISSVVQTNSATAEESAAASEELSAQAVTMKDLVGRFQLYHDVPHADAAEADSVVHSGAAARAADSDASSAGKPRRRKSLFSKKSR